MKNMTCIFSIIIVVVYQFKPELSAKVTSKSFYQLVLRRSFSLTGYPNQLQLVCTWWWHWCKTCYFPGSFRRWDSWILSISSMFCLLSFSLFLLSFFFFFLSSQTCSFGSSLSVSPFVDLLLLLFFFTVLSCSSPSCCFELFTGRE